MLADKLHKFRPIPTDFLWRPFVAVPARIGVDHFDDHIDPSNDAPPTTNFGFQVPYLHRHLSGSNGVITVFELAPLSGDGSEKLFSVFAANRIILGPFRDFHSGIGWIDGKERRRDYCQQHS